MKLFILIIGITAISCCSSQKHTTAVNNETTIATVDTTLSDATPACIIKLIDSLKQEPLQNPPRKVYSYRYNGNKVFYVTAPCCDFFSDLYDSNCKIIAHPDGGFTGRGDGKAPNFEKLKTDEKLLWEDKRK